MLFVCDLQSSNCSEYDKIKIVIQSSHRLHIHVEIIRARYAHTKFHDKSIAWRRTPVGFWLTSLFADFSYSLAVSERIGQCKCGITLHINNRFAIEETILFRFNYGLVDEHGVRSESPLSPAYKRMELARRAACKNK